MRWGLARYSRVGRDTLFRGWPCDHESLSHIASGCFVGRWLRSGKRDSVANSNAGSGSNSASDGDSRSADGNCDTHARYRGYNRGAGGRDYDRCTDLYDRTYLDTDTCSHCDSDTNFHRYRNADTHLYSNGHTRSNRNTYADPYCYTNSDSNSYAYTDSSSYCYTHADPHGYRDACSH